MREVIRLIQDIRAFLSGAAGSPPAEALAPQYVRWREDAAGRLEACAAMIAKGNEYQVLQLAETEPPLMDLVAQLAFAEEPKWLDFCQQHQLPTPVRLDSRTIQALNDIYSKGISPNSQHYRDYRAAVTSRDEDKAFRIMKSIVRLNPADSNAKTELERWQNKKMLVRLDDLKAAIARVDRDEIAVLTNEIESLGSESKLSRNEIFLEGASIRRVVLRDRAGIETTSILAQAEIQKQDGDWKSVSANTSRIRSLEKEHGLNLSGDQHNVLVALERYVERERADVKVQMEFNKALATLSTFADKVDTRMLTSTSLSLEEAEKLETTYADAWKRVERFQRPVPEGELARIQGIGSAIRHDAARKRGAKRAVKLTWAVTAMAALCAGAWTGYVAWRAYGYVDQLKDFRSRKLAAATAKLVDEIPSSAPWGATSIPALRATMEEERQWAKAELDHLRTTEKLLDDLEKDSADNFSGIPPVSLNKKLETAAESVLQLSADLANTPKDRLSQLQNKIDQHFTTLKAGITDTAEKILASLTQLVQTLDFNKSSAELAITLSSIGDVMKGLEKLRNTDTPDLKLPADLDASAQKLQNQVADFSKEMADLDRAKRDMAEAKNLETYKAALTNYSKLRLAEASVASKTVANFLSEDAFAAKLTFGGDLEAWELAKQQAKTSFKFRPTDVADSELRAILALREDAKLNVPGPAKNLLDAMHLNTVTDPSGEHYERMLIELIDTAIRQSGGDPVIRAYLVQSIFEIIAKRKNHWGVHFCPQLEKDITEMESILGFRKLRSGDWAVQTVRERVALKLKTFFDKAATGKPYLDRANAYHHLVSRFITAGVHYIGYVDDHGIQHLIPGSGTIGNAWGLPDGRDKPIPVVALTGGPSKVEDFANLMKWSPLFRIPPDIQLTP